MSDIFEAINEELKIVEAKIKDELMIKKAGHAGMFAHLEFSHIDKTMRPAIVIFSARLFDYHKEQVIVLASVMQLIYMASRVHANINETDEVENKVTDPRDGCQLPVLVGDYLFGKFFTLLSDAELIQYLGVLAETICSINEGGTLRNENPQASMATAPDLLYTIVRKETAELFANCCYLAAQISGAGEKEKEYLYNFGLNFGFGYGLLEYGTPYEHVKKYFAAAIEYLDNLSDNPTKEQLFNLVDMFQNEEFVLQRMVG
ncbi:geranylgeranyl pyrophosphate synthase [Desulfohalotomaculum tongense]|uniref:heptaprenyl diphosphate synthase component 1 n=1 Tax=Desulforadius tongensis TaxID=1216062 RepID=UPI00195E49BB|nr:polyprenyl synthetase family protein [Desulforadius tongensis]MBM7855893.1 geranylgeranyl pyrophosphate synthase [Desulforadius tongensis]